MATLGHDGASTAPSPPHVLGRAERADAGRARREMVPLAAHAALCEGSGRPDPLATLTAQDATRVQALDAAHRSHRAALWRRAHLQSSTIEEMGPTRRRRYARFCGLVLARAHARSGDAAMISGYLGDDDTFDRAIVSFAEAYADRTVADHARLVAAVDAGELEIHTGL